MRIALRFTDSNASASWAFKDNAINLHEMKVTDGISRLILPGANV